MHIPDDTGYHLPEHPLRSLLDSRQYYTDADPTSEIDSELVDTDGGFINIPDSGVIHKLMQKDTAMVIMAEKGIWLLEGDEGGFRATANKVTKVSEAGVLSGTCVVDIDDGILYWSK